MLKQKNSIHKNHKGFSLIELMVVIVILGILMSIVLPSAFSGSSEAKALQKLRIVDTLNTCIINVHARLGWGANVLANPNYESGNDALDMCIAGDVAVASGQKDNFNRVNVSGLTDMLQIITPPTAGTKGVYQVGSSVVSLSDPQVSGQLSVVFENTEDADVCELLAKQEGLGTCDLTTADSSGVIRHTASVGGVSDLTISRKLAL